MAKVFGIGQEQSGTYLLSLCLRQLGYRHQDEDPELTRRVVEEGDTEALDAAAESAQSFTGMPWPLFYRRLDRLHPDARFILTVDRCSQAWFEGLRRRRPMNEQGGAGGQIFGIAGSMRRTSEPVDLVDSHVRQAQEYFAGRPDRLLVICWEKERSWERLCRFLGQPVPDAPFPGRLRGERNLSARLRRLGERIGGYAQKHFPLRW